MRILLTFLLLNTLPVYSQSKIFEAYELWSSGHAKAAIAVLEPMLTANPVSLQGTDLGVAWGVLGSSYQTVEMYTKATRAYQMAMEVLQPIAAAKMQYAAVLDNLATMDESLDRLDEARLLCAKALRIYQDAGDRSGVTISYTNLAIIAMAQHRMKAAQQILDQAFATARADGPAGDEDTAAMDNVKTALALRAGHAKEAVAAAQDAIDSWARSRGPGYFMLGPTYLLKARALEKTGEYGDALKEAQHALDIEEATIGRDSNAYLTAKTVAAEIHKAAGDRKEAARMLEEVHRSLRDLHTRECYGCTIDASGFRQLERNRNGLSAGALPRN